MEKIINANEQIKTLLEPKELFDLVGINPQLKTEKQINKYACIYTAYAKGVVNGDDGILGKTIEKLTRREKSNKIDVAKQGKVDATAKIDGRLTPIEVKTNGGRIDNIKTSYIVYSINIDNSTGKCDICQRIIKTSTFMTKLEELKAIKEVRHNGVVDGLAIQVSKRQLWAWLETMPLYDRTKEYFSDEIL